MHETCNEKCSNKLPQHVQEFISWPYWRCYHEILLSVNDTVLYAGIHLAVGAGGSSNSGSIAVHQLPTSALPKPKLLMATQTSGGTVVNVAPPATNGPAAPNGAHQEIKVVRDAGQHTSRLLISVCGWYKAPYSSYCQGTSPWWEAGDFLWNKFWIPIQN